MNNEDKAILWEQCKKNNVFDDIPPLMNDRMIELFEVTTKENLSPNDFMIRLKELIQPLKQLNYSDLAPQEKNHELNFAVEVQDEPIQNMTTLLEQQALDRKTKVDSVFSINSSTDKVIQILLKQNEMMNNQNVALSKMIELQINIYTSLQKK
tara:strand:+ start:114 stop:572 length:459 start_codon:yes stop_codon:yes gene_type:complete